MGSMSELLPGLEFRQQLLHILRLVFFLSLFSALGTIRNKVFWHSSNTLTDADSFPLTPQWDTTWLHYSWMLNLGV